MAGTNPIHVVEIGPTATVGADTEADWYWTSRLPGKWKILNCDFMPDIAITANGTNYCVHTLSNETQSLTIATRSHAATNSVAGTVEAQTVTAGLAEYITAGDTLKLAKTDPGTGLASRSRMILTLQQVDY